MNSCRKSCPECEGLLTIIRPGKTEAYVLCHCGYTAELGTAELHELNDDNEQYINTTHPQEGRNEFRAGH